MRKIRVIIFSIFIFSIFLCFLNINISLAANTSNIPTAQKQFNTGLSQTANNAGYSGPPNKAAKGLTKRIGQVIQIFLSFLGIIFLGLIIYGGYTWMLAQGNEQEVDKAQKIIKNALLGLIIVLSAYAITHFFGDYFFRRVYPS